MTIRNYISIVILGLVAFLIADLNVQAQQEGGSSTSKSIKILIDEMKVLKDKGEKLKHIQLLREALPQTEEEIQSVMGLLDDEDVDNKCVAMELLGKIKEKKAVPKIIKNLKHKDDKVKAIAAVMLGEIGDERAIEPLLENPDLMVLEFGQSPIAKIGRTLAGFEDEVSRSLNNKFFQNGGQFTINNDAIVIEMKKKRHLPILLDALMSYQKTAIPWLNNRKLIFRTWAVS